MRNRYDYYLTLPESKEYDKLSDQIEDTLSHVLMAYQLAYGCRIDYIRPWKFKQFAFMVSMPPFSFTIWIMPFRYFFFFRRFRVDIETNNGDFIYGDKSLSIKRLPEAFSKVFDSVLELPLNLFY